MTDIDNLIERQRMTLLSAEAIGATGVMMPVGELQALTDALDTYRKRTGGLPPELVAKALAHARRSYEPDDAPGVEPFTLGELDALRATTFEGPT